MTLVDKASAFPKSVQPGIPMLGPKPFGWTRGPLSKHLVEHQRPIKMENDTEYRLVTVKRSRGGVIERERLRGRDIAVKSQHLLQAGDFLISNRQIVHGACGLVPAELEGSIASGEYSVLRGKPTIDLQFLSYLAHSTYFQQTCLHSSIGVHVEKMIFKLDRWLAWDFDIPPVAEQQRIVDILTAWDKAIAAQERLLANAIAQKKALIGRLLTGKRRLPGFKMEWSQTCVGDIATVTSGGTPNRTTPEYWNGDVPWVTTSELGDTYVTSASEYITELGLRKSAAKVFPEGTLVMAMYGQGKTRGSVSILAFEASTNQACAALLPSKLVSGTFLYYNLKSRYDEIRSLSNDGSQKNLSASLIKLLPISLPPLVEQHRIVEFLTEFDQETTLQARCLELLCKEKSALMQQLLTGKRRVKVLEEVT